jgi:GNAT superfamily N-acetyltransferase
MKTPIMPTINYKKFSWNELDKIDQNTITQISEIDNLFYRSSSDLEEYLRKIKINADKTIIYLCYRGKELVGAVFGTLNRVSEFCNKDYKIKAKPKDYMFLLTEFFVKPGFQNNGIGTALMARVFADQRAKYDSKFIYMKAFRKTQTINKKLTGITPFIVPIKEVAEIKRIVNNLSIIEKRKKRNISHNKSMKTGALKLNIFRNFKNSKYKYDLIETSNPSITDVKDHYIVINKNPKYKRKQIRSIAK